MSFYDKIVRPTTQMLLKRMDTNPEEFDAVNTVLYGSKSWATIVKSGEFNLVENILIKRKMKGIHRKATEQAILGLLLDGQARQEEEDSDLNIYQHTTVGRFSGQERFRISSDGNLGISAGAFVTQQDKKRVRKA